MRAVRHPGGVRLRRRRGLATVVALAVLATLCSCARTVDGTGSAISPAADRSSPTTTAPPASSSPPTSAPSGAADLATYLLPLPAGTTVGHTPWDRNVRPTAAQFVAEIYVADARSEELSSLTAYGLIDIAHRVFVGPQGDYADIILLRFSGPAGATARYAQTSSAAQSGDVHELPLSAPPGIRVTALIDNAVDSSGDANARVYAVAPAHNITVQAYISRTHALLRANITQWIGQQLQRLT